ncbi:cutinase family protein [Aestuariimicrobium ganziense]|uniref:cutinase family protein n=1 Tax=Aestuariimicrobium ganziense TaxID=2773677 RepID=UPI0019406D72|nr:cutinase family protein [Aestuariimicrobium ganziense]
MTSTPTTTRRRRAPGTPRVLAALVLAGWLALVPATLGRAHADQPTGWQEAPTASSKAEEQPCSDYLFIGVRGSGERAPYGPTVTRVRDGLAQEWKQGEVRQVWLEYPAGDPHTLSRVPLHQLIFERPMPSTTYFDSAISGGRTLASLLVSEHARCPHERVVMAGFSQGAQVITRALALNAGHPLNVVASILVGNPSHYPGQSVRELSGDANAYATGLGAFLYVLREQARVGDQTSRNDAIRNLIKVTIELSEGRMATATVRAAMLREHAEIPPDSYARTYSVCRAGDMVCDAGPAMAQIMVQNSTMADEIDRTRPIHGNYSEAVLAPTLTEVNRFVGGLPPVPTPTPPPSAPPVPTPAPDDDTTWWWAAGAVAVVSLGLGWLLGRRSAR